MTAERERHWEGVFSEKSDAELSWFQARPELSLGLVRLIVPVPSSAIDVGGGQSALAGLLLEAGVRDVAVLDVSAAAVARARARLGAAASRVRWMVGDVLSFDDVGRFDLWHDRACFHFLTDPSEQARYVGLAGRSVPRGGHAVIATFGPEGPEKCSGLAVRRWDAPELAGAFAPSFELVRAEQERHATPWGRVQAFTYVLLRRV